MCPGRLLDSFSLSSWYERKHADQVPSGRRRSSLRETPRVPWGGPAFNCIIEVRWEISEHLSQPTPSCQIGPVPERHDQSTCLPVILSLLTSATMVTPERKPGRVVLIRLRWRWSCASQSVAPKHSTRSGSSSLSRTDRP